MVNKQSLLLLIIILLFLSVNTIKAELDNSTPQDRLDKINISEFTYIYNQEIAGKSKMIDGIFGNEKIDFYLDQQLSFGIITSKGKIIDQKEGGINNPTLFVYIKKEDLTKLIKKELTIEEALASKKIEYHGVGFVRKTKFWIIYLIQSIFLKSEKAQDKEKKCIDSDGPLNMDSSYIIGTCTDINGISYTDKCELIEPNQKYKQVVDYDCTAEGYCEPKKWWCATTDPVYECEKGACVQCPGSDSECIPSSFNTANGLSIPDAPKPVSI